jgi:hypothetical protein
MAFTTANTTFLHFCQNQGRSQMSAPTLPSITAAAFGTLTARGQVPLTGVTGKFATYSVLNNGSVVASGLTASTYTITGLGNNVQIGPVTVVPYDIVGVAGRPFMVTGGSGSGKIYTWAYANTPTFSGTIVDGTTLACTGTFSKAYVTYSGGSATPASGTLVTGVNSISQVYSGMSEGTTYIFTVYPVNGDNLPGSTTGTNTATQSVKTLLPPPLWVAGGGGIGGNALAYSTNGTTWTGLGALVFTGRGYGVAYSTFQKRWVAAGAGGGNLLAYSTNGTTWTGLGNPIFSYYVFDVAYSTFQDSWVAVGAGNGNNLAYSTDGISWIGLGKNIFSSDVRNIAYSEVQQLWVAAGIGANNLAYSTDGISWIGLGRPVFNFYGWGVAYSTFQNSWVSVGVGNGTGNTLAYSTDGISWIGLGISVFKYECLCVGYSEFQKLWIAGGGGAGTANTLAYSTNGTSWTGLGKPVFSGYTHNVAYSTFQNRWVAIGHEGDVSGNTLAYSTNGTTWTGLGKTVFDVNDSGSCGIYASS